MTYQANLKCEGGHEQTITYRGLERAFVEGCVGIMVGDPKYYAIDPTDSPYIGKCGHPGCGKKVSAEIVEVKEAAK